MKKPKISIITPSFNQGEFIADTLESILQQSHEAFDIEYFVLDALSKDTTAAIVGNYILKLKKAGIDVTFIQEKDKGQTNAINKGLAKSSGDIFTYLNSDDFYQKDCLKTVLSFFKENPQIQWAYGGWNYVNRRGAIYSTVQPKLYSYTKLLDYCIIGQPSCFFRREAFKETGAFDESLNLGMDYDYWLRLSQRYPAGIIPTVISNMRYYGGTKSGSQATRHLLEAYRLASRYTSRFSFKRLMQFFYYLRGYFVILFGIDITRRIERKSF